MVYGTEPVNGDPDFDSDFDPDNEKPQQGGGDAMRVQTPVAANHVI